MKNFILEMMVPGTAEWNEEGLLKGHLSEDYKLHYADYGNAEKITVFHMNGKKANEFTVRNIKDVNDAKNQLDTYKNGI